MDPTYIKNVRQALGMNQVEFGRLIGRSFPSVRNYEAGMTIPGDVADRIRKIVHDRGIPISEPEVSGIPDRPPAARPENPDDPAKWHALLDKILKSGNQEAIRLAKSGLIAFEQYARTRQEKERPVRYKSA